MTTDAAILTLLLPPAALALDLLLGDPQGWPHPVRLIGAALSALENRFLGPRRSGANYRNIPPKRPTSLLLGAGAASMLGLCFVSWGLVFALGHMGWPGLLGLLYLSYAGLALGCLLREFERARALVEQGSLAEARTAVAMLVSRDTADMGRDDLRRSLAETLSENLNDGFVAPFFYLALFGPAALWMYKAVSTMDSMWGYRTARYEAIGKVAARTDDILAWLPARLTALTIVTTAAPPATWRELWRKTRADALKMSSPNAGWPMAAAAHVAGATMGGKTTYNGASIHKPILGPPDRAWTDNDLVSLAIIAKKAALYAAGALWGIGLVFFSL